MQIRGGWRLVQWMYQALFFSSRAKESKKQQNKKKKITSDLRLMSAAILVVSFAKQLPSISRTFIDLLPKNVDEPFGAYAELKT